MKGRKISAAVLSVGLGTFMASLDSGVVNLAMPLIRSEFAVSMSMVEWIVTAYLLVVSSLLLTFGRIADMYGHKRVYQTGFVLFTLGSLVCGLSVSIGMLIGARCLQALGAGMLFSTGPAIITNNVPPERRGKALSVTSVAVALGLCAGPVIGGTLTTLAGWQSIFFINLPVGVTGMLLVRRNIPNDEKRTAAKFDIAGSGMVFFALLLMLLPLSLSGDYDLPVGWFAGLLGGGLALAAVFVLFEWRRSSPMLNIKLFRNRVFSASSVAAMFIYMAQFIMVFLAPFYLQTLRGFSALASGLLYLPMPLATMAVAPISGAISDKRDSRYISSFGALVLAGGLFMMSFFAADTPLVLIIVSMVVSGLGFGMFQTPNNSAIMGNVPPQNRGTASGTLATVRNIGMALGVAVSGALFTFVQGGAKAALSVQGVAGSALETASFVQGMRVTFLVAACVALVSMAASFTKGRVKTQAQLDQEKAAAGAAKAE